VVEVALAAGNSARSWPVSARMSTIGTPSLGTVSKRSRFAD
jgi:hypothetical protein